MFNLSSSVSEIKRRQQYSEKFDLLTVRRVHELECNLSEVRLLISIYFKIISSE